MARTARKKKTEETFAEGTLGSKELAKQHASRELVFGIVGHVGSGTSSIADTLFEVLSRESIESKKYQSKIIKAR